MTWIEALILGLLQGLTEFLPVSSSGHLEIGSALFGLQEENLTFSIIVHGATFLSVIVVFRKDIINLITGLFRFEWNDETKFILLLVISALPVGIVGIVFKNQIESLFEGNILLVGTMLLVTSILLLLTNFAPNRKKDINIKSAIIMGIAQTLAILPGISRSGATISTALYLGIDREKATKFSFLMVLIPIFGASFLEILELTGATESSAIAASSLVIGALAAFVSGLLACSWMLKIVKKGKLVYFSVYTAIAGAVAIYFALF
ncbi:MAG: undecaprenyl-diphosphate phosphatase [Bacteroidales bacterium]|nr:undecaprenyl-diphosphate phosphatase [Bacteroidales bacterium]